jgi:hypothetical protein
MKIRRALLSDIPDIKEIAEKAWRPTYDHILTEEQTVYMLDLMYNYTSLCKYKGRNKLDKIINYNAAEWSDKFLFSQENSKKLIGNVCEFSGCLDSETSADAYIEKKYQGAFTYCFLKFLNNHLIKVGDKMRFSGSNIKLKDVLKEINALLDIHKFNQNSQLSVGKLGDIERLFEI